MTAPSAVLSRVLLSGGRRLLGWLRTAEARGLAIVGSATRFLPSGEVANLAASPGRISIGSHCAIGGQLLVFAHAGRIRIGDWVFVGQGSRIWSSESIEIGDRVLISHNVEIHDTESHPMDAAARAEQSRQILTTGHPRQIDGIRAAPVQIGNDVWIGFGATVRKGVRIGDRAIVGARAIVDRDVPADGIVRASDQSRDGRTLT